MSYHDRPRNAAENGGTRMVLQEFLRRLTAGAFALMSEHKIQNCVIRLLSLGQKIPQRPQVQIQIGGTQTELRCKFFHCAF